MIRAVIFDLDGTLVQTERLKAQSYARAAVELCPHEIGEDEVIEAFKDVVGLSRREVATSLVERFELGEKAAARMDEFGVSSPWQAYVQVRLDYYKEMVNDPEVIRENRWPHTLDLLAEARRAGCRVALATMSACRQAVRVLDALDLKAAFDFIATRDDIEHGKPDPEIYHLVSQELGVPPAACLVIEDSPTGVEAALNAGMHVIALGTPFTRRRLHDSGLLPAERIVEDPAALVGVVEQVLEPA